MNRELGLRNQRLEAENAELKARAQPAPMSADGMLRSLEFARAAVEKVRTPTDVRCEVCFDAVPSLVFGCGHAMCGGCMEVGVREDGFVTRLRRQGEGFNGCPRRCRDALPPVHGAHQLRL